MHCFMIENPNQATKMTGQTAVPSSSWRSMLRRYKGSHQDLGGEPAAAGGGYKADTQEFGLHAVYGARFAGNRRAGVQLLIFGVYVRHRALQNNAHRGGVGAENRLPAHRGPAVVCSGEAGQCKLRAGSGAAGKCFVVETEPDVAGEK